jgi:hypothetical protein
MSLDEQIKAIKERIKEYEDMIEPLAAELRVLNVKKAEMEAAKHGLKEGDYLLITSECNYHLDKRRWSKWQREDWSLGDILEFKFLDDKRKTCNLGTGSTGSGNFPLDMVKRMRAAYLDSIKDVE